MLGGNERCLGTGRPQKTSGQTWQFSSYRMGSRAHRTMDSTSPTGCAGRPADSGRTTTRQADDIENRFVRRRSPVHCATPGTANYCKPLSSWTFQIAVTFIAATGEWVNPEGMLDAHWAKTGERSYCFVCLWESKDKLIDAQSQMIEHLNKVRHCFEELSDELGLTDPVSGPVLSHKN